VWWAGDIGGCPSHPCIPPVPNSALTDVTGWVHTAQRSVPVSWPVLGIAPAPVQGNWMGRGGISDYASQYWDSFNLRHTYPWSGGVQGCEGPAGSLPWRVVGLPCAGARAGSRPVRTPRPLRAAAEPLLRPCRPRAAPGGTGRSAAIVSAAPHNGSRNVKRDERAG